MSKRGCKHSTDAFCFVCGEFIKTRAKKHSVLASAVLCKAYKSYFGMPVGDQNRSWAPHFACDYCKKTLEGKSKVYIPVMHVIQSIYAVSNYYSLLYFTQGI